MRTNEREANQLRPIAFTRHYIKHAEGSVLVESGDTKVICTASITPGVPFFLKGSKQGWLTAEYGMLPRATDERNPREAAKGKQTGRTSEIQRLIGRSLRTVVDLKALGENTITIDCDVIQADGGTRTAAITGGCIALMDALSHLKKTTRNPFKQRIAAVSVGIVEGRPLLDLEYSEDSKAEVDMTVVMTDQGEFVEIQGAAEKRPFQPAELTAMLDLAKQGLAQLFEKQKAALELNNIFTDTATT